MLLELYPPLPQYTSRSTVFATHPKDMTQYRGSINYYIETHGIACGILPTAACDYGTRSHNTNPHTHLCPQQFRRWDSSNHLALMGIALPGSHTRT